MLISDSSLRRVVGRTAILFHDRRLAEKNRSASRWRSGRNFGSRVMAGTCPLKKWTHSVEQWIARLISQPRLSGMELPPIGDDDPAILIEQICQGATSYKETRSGLSCGSCDRG